MEFSEAFEKTFNKCKEIGDVSVITTSIELLTMMDTEESREYAKRFEELKEELMAKRRPNKPTHYKSRVTFFVGNRVSHRDRDRDADKYVTRKGTVNKVYPPGKGWVAPTYGVTWDEPNPKMDCHSYSGAVLKLIQD